MNTGKIYIIKNTINNKVYIGQTITPLEVRQKNHLYNARNINLPDNKVMIIYDAMRKYGIENFYIELLEDNIPRTELNNKEAYQIKEFNSIRPNGYNILDGENSSEPFQGKKVYQLDKNTLNIINSFNSESEAETALHLTPGNISRVLRNVQLTTGGYRQCLQDNYDNYIKNPPLKTNGKNYYNKEGRENKQSTKIILQIDSNTNEVVKEQYNGAVEAAKTIQKDVTGIYGVLKGKRKTCGGYV